MFKEIKKYLSKLFGANTYIGTTPTDSLKPARAPLENRLSIEAKELDYLIDYLVKVRKSLDYKSVINAADVKVTSQEVLRAAEHAKTLALLFKDAEYNSISNIKKRFISAIENAGKYGYYSAILFFDVIKVIDDKESYICVKDYYNNLVKSVNMYIAIKDLQRKGFKFRIADYDFIISTDITVADELIINPKYLGNYKRSMDIEPVMEAYKISARKLYDEFPEFFGADLRRRFNFK